MQKYNKPLTKTQLNKIEKRFSKLNNHIRDFSFVKQEDLKWYSTKYSKKQFAKLIRDLNNKQH